MAVTPTPGIAHITSGIPGQAVDALQGNLSGGYIFNPANSPAVLYVDPTGPASTQGNGSSMAIEPGGTYYAIPGSTLPVSVASNVPNMSFVSVQWI
ncbi:MAG TPA: hypothetical protein VNZ45_12970 [Bacteroidia bacterium]|jgi:hypothetical protein|nr:hypothetical protein [Bacteroidia bacterium]